MARNVEIKALIDGIDSILPRVAAIANEGPIEIDQDDTFFACDQGRLKLRVFSPDSGELILYCRTDRKGPKESFYVLSPTSTPGALRETLSRAYGQAGRVRKHRTLFIAGRTRIHLDRVEGLGEFLELEVVLADGESAETGEAVARELMEKMRVQPEQLLEGAYVDMLALKAHDKSDLME